MRKEVLKIREKRWMLNFFFDILISLKLLKLNSRLPMNFGDEFKILNQF
jgi:hypothetical protein